MPLAAAARPRKILPPPITMQIWLPASAASFTSAAMRSTVAMSMPKAPSPINASPETFKSTRAYLGGLGINIIPPEHGPECIATVYARSPAVRPTSTRTSHLSDLVGEIAFDFLDALAHLEADEAFDRDGSTQFLGGLLDHLADLGFAIDHEGLGQKHRVFVEFAHAAFHHLLDDRIGLAGLLGQFPLDIALALHHILGKMLGRD